MMVPLAFSFCTHSLKTFLKVGLKFSATVLGKATNKMTPATRTPRMRKSEAKKVMRRHLL